MSETPLVSVVMPAFNAGIFISEAIDSIRDQSFKNWELIVVDDGSTDDTAAIVKQHASADQRIRLRRIEHQGIANALNEGISFSTAPFIMRMDADDISAPERMERQLRFLQTNPEIGVVAGGVDLIKRENRSGGLEAYVDWVNSLTAPRDLELGRFIDSPLIHPSVCFRRELVAVHGGYLQGDFPEDYELWLRWLDAGVQMAKIPEIVLGWRDHDAKLTRNDKRYREEVLWSTKGRYFSNWMRQNVDSSRELLVWGSGRKTRSRLRFLSSIFERQSLIAYIDIDSRKIGQRIVDIPVISPEEIVSYRTPFIIGMVGSRGARNLIRENLKNQRFVEGSDFVFLA